MSELKKKISSGLLWLGSASAISQIVTWAFTILIARLLTPADYGLYAIAGVYIGLLEFLNEFGIGSAIVQKENISESEISGLFGLSLYWSTALCLLTFLFAPEISSAIHGPELVSMLRVLSFSFIISAFKNIQYNLLVREMRFKEIAKIEAVVRISSVIFSYTLALSGFGVWALVSSYIAYNLIQAISYSFLVRIRFNLLPSIKQLHWHINFGFQVIIGRFFGAISGRVETMVVGKLLGMQLLGVYTFAQVLAFKPIDTLIAILNQVFFPVFSRMQNEEHLRNQYILKVLEIELIIIIPLYFLMAATTSIFVPVILGPKWNTLTPFLSFFSIIGIFVFLASKATMLLISAGKPKPQIWFRATQLIALPTLFLILSQKPGYNGILTSWAIVYPTISIIYFSTMVRQLNLPIRTTLRCFVVPIAIGIIVAASVLAAKTILVTPNWPNLIGLLSIGCAMALVSLAVLAREKAGEILRNVRAAVA